MAADFGCSDWSINSYTSGQTTRKASARAGGGRQCNDSQGLRENNFVWAPGLVRDVVARHAQKTPF